MLKTPRITLTGLRLEDSDILYSWIDDAETVRFNAPYRPVDRAGHDAWFSSIGKDPNRIAFAIRAKEQIIGVVQLIDIHPIHRSAELVIRIGEDANRGRGYGTEALRAVVQYAWMDLNLQRIWLRVFHTNERAIAAYQKAGFELEGRMRRACFIDGNYIDELVFSALIPQ